jgi:hypothetical protein
MLPGKWYIIIAGILASLAGYLVSVFVAKEGVKEEVIKGEADYEH